MLKFDVYFNSPFCSSCVCKTENKLKLTESTSDWMSHTAIVYNVKTVNKANELIHDVFYGDDL